MGYYLLYGFCRLLALMPLWILFGFSDLVLYPLLYYVIGYRKKVVRRNLAASFPEKTDKERSAIERGFYHQFCDYMVESLKLLHYSEKQMNKHVVFKGVEKVHELYEKGGSGFMFLGHYANWEWLSSLGMHIPELRFPIVYRPLKNKAFDRLFITLRSQFKGFTISKNEILRYVITNKKEGVRFFVATLADQTPSTNNIHYYTTFLNQDTPVFTGTERMAKKTNTAIFYLDVIKIKRGYYEGHFELITDTPSEMPEFEITECYMRKMEQTILRNPALYLWTHKRWKHSRDQVKY